MVAETAFKRLEKAAQTWIGINISTVSQITPPRDIAIDCGTFLSAAGIVSKILFEGNRRQQVASRCCTLRQLLDLGECRHLQNLSVRNSFEHIDERIDELFSSFNAHRFRVESLSVAEQPPPTGTILFKRFDPKTLCISFGEDEISLTGCMSELSTINSKFLGAIKKLEDNVVHLWAT